MSKKDPPADSKHSPDDRPPPARTPAARSSRASRRLQFSLPFNAGTFSSVPSPERLLASVLSGAPIILCVLDVDWNISYIDGLAYEDLQISPDTILGHSVFDLFQESDDLRMHIGRAFEGNIVRTSHTLRGQTYQIAILPLTQQNSWVSGVIVVATMMPGGAVQTPAPIAPAPPGRNLTLEIAHELRTPLNSILGFANLVLRAKADDLAEQERFYLERIIGNTNHLLSVVGQVLDVPPQSAGTSSQRLTEEHLGALVFETVGELKGLVLNESVRIVADVPEGLPALKTDRVKLKQIMINLVSNALKYTHAGTVTVSVIPGEDLQPRRIDIVDTGEGIPSEKLQTIFNAFDRGSHAGDKSVEGLGLGLSIARSLSSMLGYTITVASEPGKGSTFSIHLVPPPTPL